METLSLIGFASGAAANNPGCALGPWFFYYQPYFFEKIQAKINWRMLPYTTPFHGLDLLPDVKDYSEKLGREVLACMQTKQAFCVIGGDHSSAIGTWSGVAHAKRHEGDIGLIWIDAHMDSHTPETSLSKNIHGMPLAHLLGRGDRSLCEILDAQPKLKPQNISLIGLRSYEDAETNLLQGLGVKLFFMPEIEKRGIATIFAEAYKWVNRNTCGYGISIDLDGFDPNDAPGVGYREPNGINAQAFLKLFRQVKYHQGLLGMEIVEYNPLLDINNKTAHLLVDLVESVFHD